MERIHKGFGVNEFLPTGLTWQFKESSGGEVLYMIGKTNQRLYYLNRQNGRAYPVDSHNATPDFGVGASSSTDMTSHKETLFMIDHTQGKVFTLDVVSGMAEPQGDMASFGITGQSPKGIASYNDKLYVVCASKHTSNMPIGQTSALPQPPLLTCALYELSDADSSECINIAKFFPSIWPSGLFVIGKILYMAVQDSPSIYILDVENSRVVEMDSGNTPAQLRFTRFPNMRADFYEKYLYVVGQGENARLQVIDEKEQVFVPALQHPS